MAEHPNAELLRNGYAAFQTGDMDALRNQYFAPDAVWHVGGHNKFSGDHKGVDAILQLFMDNFTETDGTFKVELHDVLGNDEHAVALATVSGTKGGKQLSDNYTHVVHNKDGKLVESWIFAENPDKVDEFWGS